MSRPGPMMVDPYPDPEHPLPRPILWGAAALALTTIAMVAAAHSTGIGTFRNPQTTPVESRDLQFSDLPDGSLGVEDVRAHREVGRVAPETGGFIRAALRGLSRNRVQHGDSQSAPYRLGFDADGRLWLEDLATRQSIDLRAFGPTNAEAFAAFLRPGEKPQ